MAAVALGKLRYPTPSCLDEVEDNGEKAPGEGAVGVDREEVDKSRVGAGHCWSELVGKEDKQATPWLRERPGFMAGGSEVTGVRKECLPWPWGIEGIAGPPYDEILCSFDPLAAIIAKKVGLNETCQKVLGSQVRVGESVLSHTCQLHCATVLHAFHQVLCDLGWRLTSVYGDRGRKELRKVLPRP